MKRDNRLKWYKLDNAAKIYPILTSERFTYVFRVSATLYKPVNADVLYQAILDSKKRFPSFFVRIRRGFFWYYFEENILPPILDQESPFVCKKIMEHFNNHYWFQFLYFNNRISLEINHSLTDGGGAIQFLNAVIYHYLELMGETLSPEGLIMQLKEPVDPFELEDGYERHFSGGGLNPPQVPKAYFYTPKMFRKYGSGVINSFLESNQFIDLVKASKSSMTEYIVALLIYSVIINGDKKKMRKYPVNICVPVNLRKVYNSKTLSNFSLYFHVSYKMKSEDPDFDDILNKVKHDFIEENTLEKIQSKLDTVCTIQKKIFIRLIPLPIKYFLFKIGYQAFGRKPTTITISNFGIVKVPKSMEKHIESFSFYMGSGLKHAIAINSFKGNTSIVFSRSIINTNLEETFFKFLSSKGLNIKLVSNYWEKGEKGFPK